MAQRWRHRRQRCRFTLRCNHATLQEPPTPLQRLCDNQRNLPRTRRQELLDRRALLVHPAPQETQVLVLLPGQLGDEGLRHNVLNLNNAKNATTHVS